MFFHGSANERRFATIRYFVGCLHAGQETNSCKSSVRTDYDCSLPNITVDDSQPHAAIESASSTDRALMNLVEGSWPPYHSADMASIISHDPRATLIMEQINQEIAVIEANHLAGISMILQRVAERPGYYILWYLQKSTLLWGWSIRIGAGDIYVYVTYHSPFDTSPAWRAIEALCHSINPLLMLLALATCLIALLQKRRDQALEIMALLLIFVTAVHTALQAEPRYSIPYRGAEIVMAVFAVYWLRTCIPRLGARLRGRAQNTATRMPSANG